MRRLHKSNKLDEPEVDLLKLHQFYFDGGNVTDNTCNGELPSSSETMKSTASGKSTTLSVMVDTNIDSNGLINAEDATNGGDSLHANIRSSTGSDNNDDSLLNMTIESNNINLESGNELGTTVCRQ